MFVDDLLNVGCWHFKMSKTPVPAQRWWETSEVNRHFRVQCEVLCQCSQTDRTPQPVWAPGLGQGKLPSR